MSYLPNGQSNLVIAHRCTVSIVLTFHKHNSLPLCRYEPSSPVSWCAPRPFLLEECRGFESRHLGCRKRRAMSNKILSIRGNLAPWLKIWLNWTNKRTVWTVVVVLQCDHIWQIFATLCKKISLWQFYVPIFRSILASLLCHWANDHCFKWPNN